MAILTPEEYNISYFDGKKTTLRHNAGYSTYERWYRKDGENSLGEFWKDRAADYAFKYQLQGKNVLDIGCAKGFIVNDLRSMGVDAYGLDISQYAIDNAETEAQPYLKVADAKTELSTYKDNEFDVVFSLRFLECLDEAEIPSLVTEMNRISKFQFHVIDIQPNPDYYLVKPLSWWINFNWFNSTVLIARESNKEVVI